MIDEIKRPYVFMVPGKNGRLEEYSGRFVTKGKALAWRNHPDKGLMLKRVFNRELILTYRGEKITI